jgi:hypothetical protein
MDQRSETATETLLDLVNLLPASWQPAARVFVALAAALSLLAIPLRAALRNPLPHDPYVDNARLWIMRVFDFAAVNSAVWYELLRQIVKALAALKKAPPAAMLALCLALSPATACAQTPLQVESATVVAQADALTAVAAYLDASLPTYAEAARDPVLMTRYKPVAVAYAALATSHASLVAAARRGHVDGLLAAEVLTRWAQLIAAARAAGLTVQGPPDWLLAAGGD